MDGYSRVAEVSDAEAAKLMDEEWPEGNISAQGFYVRMIVAGKTSEEIRIAYDAKAPPSGGPWGNTPNAHQTRFNSYMRKAVKMGIMVKGEAPHELCKRVRDMSHDEIMAEAERRTR